MPLGNPSCLELSGQRTGFPESCVLPTCDAQPPCKQEAGRAFFFSSILASPPNRGSMQLSALASKEAWDCPVETTPAHRTLELLEEEVEVTSPKSHDSTYLCMSRDTSAITLGETLATQKAPHLVHSHVPGELWSPSGDQSAPRGSSQAPTQECTASLRTDRQHRA